MQKNNLHFSSKIEVRRSQIEGWGVFAKEDIEKGEILEESPFIILPSHTLISKNLFDILRANNFLNIKEKYETNLIKNLGFKDADDYYFKWAPKHQPDGENLIYTVLPLGFGPIYNTSNSTNNAEWKIENNYFVFSASKKIKKDDEICTFYGYFLDEDGNKFECDDVFNIGLDYFNGRVGFESIRFGNLESHLKNKNNPFVLKIASLFAKKSSPVYIKSISAISQNGNTEASINIPENINLKLLFNKLKECKNSSFYKIKFSFEYTNKIFNLTETEEVEWINPYYK